VETPPTELAKLRTRACVVFPHGTMANSPTEVLAITPEARFGPFTGQLLVGEMNQPRIMRVMLEEVGGELQGACAPFIDGAPLLRGCNRMAWAPDGSLYVGHTRHTWAGSQGIQRIEWDGGTPFEAQTMKLTKTGFRFTFTQPVDKTIAGKKETWPFQRYFFEYTRTYGSPRHDEVPVAIEGIDISPDGRIVDLHLSELKAWHLHEVNIKDLKSATGVPLANAYYVYTLNRLLENTPPEPLQASLKKARSPKRAKSVPVKNPKGIVYEAEDARRKGPTIRSNNPGFTGQGFLDFGSGDQSIEWIVMSKKAGEGEILIRYALQSGKRPLKLLVNGALKQTLPFPGTGGWSKWSDIRVKVPLKSGKNSITLQTLGSSGGNIDHLQLIEP